MRRVVRFAAVLILTALSLLVAPQSACACSCAFGSEKEFTDHADVIFVGVVTALDGGFSFGGGGEVQVDFVVEKVLKGSPGEKVTLTTATDSAACGFDFSIGHRFQVYGHEGGTGLCSGNKALGAAPEVPIHRPFPVRWVVVGGGVVIAAAIGVVLYRRRQL